MLNERIRQLRLAKGLTLQQVGDAFGISRSSVAAWENAISKPDTSKLVRLAELLDTSVEYLLGSGEQQALIEVAMLRNEPASPRIPFVRWTLVSQDIYASNPTQHVDVHDCVPGIGAFATRLALAGEWDWTPCAIPAGAILIVNPHDSLAANDFVIASFAKQPVELMQVSLNKKLLIKVNKINTPSLDINNKKIRILGRIIHWRISSGLV
jgi:transcriptional regulator with XRE-family HTH domain